MRQRNDTVPGRGDSFIGGDRLRVGVDLAPVAEIQSSMARYGHRYIRRLFTEQETADTAGSAQALGLAARFAAKEAAMKVLGPDTDAPGWRSIEVRQWPGGRCTLLLHGEAKRLAAERGLDEWALSMCHEGPVAVAVVVATRSCGLETASDRGRTYPLDMRTNSGANGMDDTIRTILGAEGKLYSDAATIGEDVDLFDEGLSSHASVNVMLALEDAYDFEFPDYLLRKETFSTIRALRNALVEIGVADR